ncbi:hypothetical protein SADUNF_Sadunf01G0142700 [Salix dunnii]|uniref:Uncharacterized protein n=1 Tax=Salix dunnii TaxID=1413687 RepID=A0A835NCA8_9ROSI|nr:hypothetical protein SADUNF_Sadunf01G0142700 [Salix dunnii]
MNSTVMKEFVTRVSPDDPAVVVESPIKKIMIQNESVVMISVIPFFGPRPLIPLANPFSPILQNKINISQYYLWDGLRERETNVKVKEEKQQMYGLVTAAMSMTTITTVYMGAIVPKFVFDEVMRLDALICQASTGG